MKESLKKLLRRIDRLKEEFEIKAPKLVVENEIRLIFEAAEEVKKYFGEE